MILKVTVSQAGLDKINVFLKSLRNRIGAEDFRVTGIYKMEALVRGKNDFGFELRGHYNQFLPVVRIIRTEGFQYSDLKGINFHQGCHVTFEIAEAIRIYYGGVMDVPPNSRLLISSALHQLTLMLCEAFEIPD